MDRYVRQVQLPDRCSTLETMTRVGMVLRITIAARERNAVHTPHTESLTYPVVPVPHKTAYQGHRVRNSAFSHAWV